MLYSDEANQAIKILLHEKSDCKRMHAAARLRRMALTLDKLDQVLKSEDVHNN